MPLTANELRAHFSPRRVSRPNYFALAVAAARQQAAAVAPASLVVESLIVSADAMPHHYIARAVILDLQPSQMVDALSLVEDEIRKTHRHAQRTGWRAASDGLTVFFYAWTPTSAALAA